MTFWISWYPGMPFWISWYPWNGIPNQLVSLERHSQSTGISEMEFWISCPWNCILIQLASVEWHSENGGLIQLASRVQLWETVASFIWYSRYGCRKRRPYSARILGTVVGNGGLIQLVSQVRLCGTVASFSCVSRVQDRTAVGNGGLIQLVVSQVQLWETATLFIWYPRHGGLVQLVSRGLAVLFILIYPGDWRAVNSDYSLIPWDPVYSPPGAPH